MVLIPRDLCFLHGLNGCSHRLPSPFTLLCLPDGVDFVLEFVVELSASTARLLVVSGEVDGDLPLMCALNLLVELALFEK